MEAFCYDSKFIADVCSMLMYDKSSFNNRDLACVCRFSTAFLFSVASKIYDDFSLPYTPICLVIRVS